MDVWCHWLLPSPETELRQQLAERDAALAALKHRVAAQESEIAIHRRDIEHLSDVLERNRRRTQAEMAAAAYQTATATMAGLKP